ncbi:hypothetical protein [Candidatus Chromulinivorax destructor]|uniref:Uncharacterized protein n=1 Tax=Candidatus Chromulinivorax destructor TaxID=2066483 RepID=A0A345ZBS5_9BACT|nr:hypothetical protein [Candidatus Chromulinivorax destructor]AXK60742.1 hypothetical protein C0J27_03230 [Candidatus Chromulinivorax destructor]
MNRSNIILLMLASFGYENLKAAENFTQVASDKIINIIFQEPRLISGFCCDCTQEDKADLKEFGSKLVVDYKSCAKNCTYQYYPELNRIISSDKIGDVNKQFTAFRAAKNAERAVLAAKENLKRAKVALHYENLSKAMQQSLDLN